jgi:Asp-tRNA(Asn)/Glu-tRNA(Gln) amidotransferase A subunit family amidase
MSLALIVIPDPSAPSREHGLDAQQVFHLPGLEDPALRVDQRNAFAAELKSDREPLVARPLPRPSIQACRSSPASSPGCATDKKTPDYSYGALFTGRAWSEPTLLRLAYAFEQ